MLRIFGASALFALGLLVTPASASTVGAGMEAYRNGDFEAAADIWRRLADAGDPLAQFNLGILHDLGQGVPRDAATAAEWFRRSAEQGDPIAAYNLGLMLAEGRGVPADPEAAAEWFRFASDLGHTASMMSLSILHATGRGVPRNLGEALRLDELANETECLVEDSTHNHMVRSTPLVLMPGT